MKTKLNFFVYTLPKSYIGGGCTLRERRGPIRRRSSWVREAAGTHRKATRWSIAHFSETVLSIKKTNSEHFGQLRG